MKVGRTDKNVPETENKERSADMYSPGYSPVALTIVDYRFGTSPEATRPDSVLRYPTAALLIQRRGQLYECVSPGQRVPLPEMALLGPTCKAHIWETAPNTWFTLVNLAPGAVQALFGIDPRDVFDQVEPLDAQALPVAYSKPEIESAAALNTSLCQLIRGHDKTAWHLHRARKAYMAIKEEKFGPNVKNYADHLGTTPRTMRRMVSKSVGLTTKQVLAVQRARRLILLACSGWSRSIADLAEEAGFYDQSHMRYELDRIGIEKVGQLLEGNHILTEL